MVLVPVTRAGDKGNAAEFYPLKPGTQWHYRVTSDDKQVGTVVSRVAKIETIDGQPLARLETVVMGNVVNSEHVQANARGVFRHRVNGIEVEPPLCILRFPIKFDDTWESECKMGEMKFKGAHRVGRKEIEIEVPAGKFKVVPVYFEARIEGVDVTTTYYFAHGKGMIRQVAEINGSKLQLDLEKLEPGK
jgi:hypothetical protein